MVLDGNVGNRTYDYIKSFGQCVNIVNDIKTNQKEFIVTQDSNDLNKKIIENISNGEKVVIVSMSKGKCDTFYQKLNSEFPNKKF